MFKQFVYYNGSFIEVSLKSALKSFISSHIEDFGNPPSVELLQRTFKISQLDANMALYFYAWVVK